MTTFRLSATMLYLISTLILPFLSSAHSTALDPEEQRVLTISDEFSDTANRFSVNISQFKSAIKQVSNYQKMRTVVKNHGEKLWRVAVTDAQATKYFDDRPLYWARLMGRIALKELGLEQSKTTELLNDWEDSSRGLNDIRYAESHTISRIFLTGFDPFLLDRNIEQSNPSGVTALMLDGKIIDYQGKKIQIETVMIPVRFDDFDQGLIERILTPLMDESQRIQLMTTVSMGRTDFDLERFPGKRRSATISGNRNVITGASATNPLIPLLNGTLHQGAEFVEFSLPVALMQRAQGAFKINDNHVVTTLAKGKITPQSLSELRNEIAVTGSGGSYLSNEISYRSVALRDHLKSDIAVGHIHTPRITSFQPKVIEQTVIQITGMLKHASTGFK